MKTRFLLPFAFLALFCLGACGALSSLAQGARESGQLQQRADELQRKMDLLDRTLEAYGPLAEDLGPEIKAKYDELLKKSEEVQGYVAEGRELLGEAMDLHQKSLAQATNPDTGETDWLEYALLMLAGGGGLYSERRRTAKERDKLHERVDDKSRKVKDLQAQVNELKHLMELEAARRAATPSA